MTPALLGQLASPFFLLILSVLVLVPARRQIMRIPDGRLKSVLLLDRDNHPVVFTILTLASFVLLVFLVSGGAS